ncbi:acetylglutamate kinase [Tenacibaculum sp. M341]|uniref:acetylglutamate kinase n=1 Tax=Tenacibaculum sp. M341 TaxID=2530339 RepID=UPI0010475645|nr:acetylglutamate kinase [Tenacibaculum sp. M341]TCI90553.1 acetylglutamate kinase [Tenacibaculum sp. M341]
METLKIIKIGGNIINNDELLNDFLSDFAQLSSPKILVHGGGKSASELSKKMGIEPKMIHGRRVTDADTLEIITMVYGGKINKNVVAKLQAKNCNSVGFSGADGNTIVSVKRPVKDIDYGFAGDIVKVNTDVLEILLPNNITPVFCAITHNKHGQLLNTNADTIAAELAVALSEKYNVSLYYCFEKNGVLEDINNENSVIERINSSIFNDLKNNGIINEGMLPKIHNCLAAIEKGVKSVHIGSPTMPFNAREKCTTFQQ